MRGVFPAWQGSHESVCDDLGVMSRRATTKGPRDNIVPTVNVMVSPSVPSAGSVRNLRGRMGQPDLGWQQ